MRLTYLLLLLITLTCNAFSQTRRNSAYQQYINKYKNMAIEQMVRHNIPASITLAQGLLESGAGRSRLATHGNNHFGIKCHGWGGKGMRMDDDERNECFRVYKNARDSYEDHSLFLKKPRYKRLFSLSKRDYKGWAKGLKACGYATNPRYAQSLIDIIETYELHQYDKAKDYDHYLAIHAGAGDNSMIGGYEIVYNNKNYYVVARQGDTFKSIGKKLDISSRKLARYNERDRKAPLSAGDIIYLKKKRTKADKRFKRVPHTIRAGESMYDISQRYGIRLKSLYKKNDLSPDYTPRVGDVLKVY